LKYFIPSLSLRFPKIKAFPDLSGKMDDRADYKSSGNEENSIKVSS